MYIYSGEMFFESRVKSGASVDCSKGIGKGVQTEIVKYIGERCIRQVFGFGNRI